MLLLISVQIMMMFCVFTSSENYEIFHPIIIPYAIYVMHDFMILKISTQVLFHYKSMFENVMPVRGCFRMTFASNTNVPLMINSASFPVSGNYCLLRLWEHRDAFVPYFSTLKLIDVFLAKFFTFIPWNSSNIRKSNFVYHSLRNFSSFQFLRYFLSNLGRWTNPLIPCSLSFVCKTQFQTLFRSCILSFIPSSLSTFKTFVPWDSILIFHAVYDTKRMEV